MRRRRTDTETEAEAEKRAMKTDDDSPWRRRTSPPSLLPGLPDDIATLCLARVHSLSLLWKVSPSWQSLISTSTFFHSLRSSLGFKPHNWFYALLHNNNTTTTNNNNKGGASNYPSSSSSSSSSSPHHHHHHHHHPAFSWHAFDPLSHTWFPLPPLPGQVDFQLTSPNFIGLFHAVQCVSSSTKLFMVAGSAQVGRRKIVPVPDFTLPDRVPDDKDPLDPPPPRDSNPSSSSSPRRSLEPALDCPLIFDTCKWNWSLGPPFRVPRRWCACGIMSDKHLIVASGCGKDWDLALSKSAEMYDPDVEQWVALERLKSSKFSGQAINAVNFKGKLHMVCGKGVGVMYDPKTCKWMDMPKGMRNGWNGPSVVVDEKLFVLEETIGRLKCYDENGDCWTNVMEDEMLMGMNQLTGAAPGNFCGILRAPPANYEVFTAQQEKKHSPDTDTSRQVHHRDVIRIVDIQSKPPSIKDIQVPFGEIVALQVLSRTFFDTRTRTTMTHDQGAV